MTSTFLIGDNVRITKKQKTFVKGYTQRWMEEVVSISKFQLTIPVTSKITDYNGQEIQGSIYNKIFKRRSRTYLG